MKDEWEIMEDMNVPKNLEKAVKADLKRFTKRLTGSKEFKQLSKKEREQMMKWIPSVVVSAYMMSVVTAIMSDMMKKKKGK